ncbi:bicyclomycin resistance protein [mine drainage metagenome]|uniref:Bicyclomycin resistance protein n=1 Tax=mine drainage metagenome TaxID=410659 RepID=A0A1J5RWJ7_9ZZZZ
MDSQTSEAVCAPGELPGALPTERSSGSRRRDLWAMVVLSILMGFGSISTDVYLPAIPSMATALRAGHGPVEFTIGAYLIGFSLGQLVWGPLGDRYGRRGPIAVGLLLFIAGSAGCALSPNVWVMIGWRIAQAVGACSGVVLARAMVRDIHAPDRAAQMLSTLITIMAVAPLVGPLAGGQILMVASWRAIFWVMVGVGLVAFGALFTIPETLPTKIRKTNSLGQAFAEYLNVIRDRDVLINAGVGGLFYIGIYAYISGTPFAFIEYYHVPEQLYGFLFAASIIGIMATNMLNVRLISRFGSRRLLRIGALGAALAGTLSAVTASVDLGGLFGLVVPLLAYCAMSGVIVANSIAGALSRQAVRAGTASALVGALHYGMGIAGSGLIALFANGTPRPLGGVIAASGLAAFALSRFLAPQSK